MDAAKSPIVNANSTRKHHIAARILSKEPKTVGIYRLTMKAGSDNFRQSAIRDIMSELADSGVEIIIYEPTLDCESYQGMKVINDLTTFKEASDIIIANRLTSELDDIHGKVYSRDNFRRD